MSPAFIVTIACLTSSNTPLTFEAEKRKQQVCRGNFSLPLENVTQEQAPLGSRQPGIELDMSTDAVDPFTGSSGQRTAAVSVSSRTLSHHTTGTLPCVQAGIGVSLGGVIGLCVILVMRTASNRSENVRLSHVHTGYASLCYIGNWIVYSGILSLSAIGLGRSRAFRRSISYWPLSLLLFVIVCV
jgi:hypothetical protein